MTTPVEEITAPRRGGISVVLRPLTPMDRDRYLAGVANVGPQSRYLRFLGPKPVLSEGEIRYFTEVDHHDHEAILAVIGDAVVGVARYIRDRDDRGLAEFAVVVVDAWQGHGVGTALLRRLAERASDEGVERLHGTVLHENTGMFATLRRLGLPWRTMTSSRGVTEVEVTPPSLNTARPAARAVLGLVA